MRRRSRPPFSFLLALTVALVLGLGTLGLWALWNRRPLDLIVYGATPQGVTAAVEASRSGLRVLLLEPGPGVGGVLTRSWLATLDMTNDARGEPLYGGLFRDFLRGIGHDPSFDVRTAERALRAMLRGAFVPLRTDAPLERVVVRGGRIVSLTVRAPHGNVSFRAPYFIDATDTADLAARAGARFTLGRADTGLGNTQMAATLVFALRGVNWPALKAALRAEDALHHDSSGSHGRTAQGFGPLAAGYLPSDRSRFRLRGLNLARQDDGRALVNALLIFGVDGASPRARRIAWMQARREAGRVAAYLREAEPKVFGKAALAGVAPELYVRESRHLVGLARLRADQVLLGARFPDGVAVGGYGMDGQAYLPGEAFYALGKPAPYEVPLRALVPRGLFNLLLASQAASFDSTAAFSARVVPLQMALGQAAGAATGEARREDASFPGLAERARGVARVRALLRRRGVLVDAPRNPWASEESAPGAATARELLRRGIWSASPNLQGRLGLRQPLSGGEFLNDLSHLLAPRGEQLTSALAALPARPTAPLTSGGARAVLASLGEAQFAPPQSGRTLTKGEEAGILAALARDFLPHAPFCHDRGTLKRAAPAAPTGKPGAPGRE